MTMTPIELYKSLGFYERNIKMFALMIEGQNSTQIGAQWSISKLRVEQIIHRLLRLYKQYHVDVEWDWLPRPNRSSFKVHQHKCIQIYKWLRENVSKEN